MVINSKNINLKLLKLLILVSVLGSAIYSYALELETSSDDETALTLIEVDAEESKNYSLVLLPTSSLGGSFSKDFENNSHSHHTYFHNTSKNIGFSPHVPIFILYHQLKVHC